MKRAVLITGHFAHQKRKGSMLWVSDHLQQMGWHVTIVTMGYSWLSRLKGDARLGVFKHLPTRGIDVINPTLSSQFELPLIHPFKTRFEIADTLLAWPFRHFTTFWHKRLQSPLRHADLVICESGPPVLLGPSVAALAPDAARIYRVNDDVRLLNAPQMLIRAETDNLQCFTRISTASPLLAKRFRDHENVTLDPMGIPKTAVEQPMANPFDPTFKGRVAVCAGTTQLDVMALQRIAAKQSHWQIHVLGRLKSPPPRCPTSSGTGNRTLTSHWPTSPMPTSVLRPIWTRRGSLIKRPIQTASCCIDILACRRSGLMRCVTAISLPSSDTARRTVRHAARHG
ncbi:hypothetical protein [Sulfitobacter aestuariivivens]|uniref:GumK N-terminal domain-containing glycosyltransferase n=1 Tax=Sulfitobacter aestuariivivens TaxID=2766981 RepID=UPI0036099D6D